MVAVFGKTRLMRIDYWRHFIDAALETRELSGELTRAQTNEDVEGDAEARKPREDHLTARRDREELQNLRIFCIRREGES